MTADPPAPIVVLAPDAEEARQIAGWLRSAGLGMVATARTCDEAIFLLGRKSASLLIIDEHVSDVAERRLLQHISGCGHTVSPALVRLMGQASPCGLALGRAKALETVQKPLTAHDIVVRVGSAMQRPDLITRLDRDREAADQSLENLDAARRMQIGLLPTPEQLGELEADCGIGIAALCAPGEAVGGDFWGVWPTGRGRFALAVVDFAGHGLSAALNTFRLHAVLSERRLPRGLPARMAALLNERLHSLLSRGQYATMVYLQIDPATHRVAWCGAGGPAPLFVSAGSGQDLIARGLPLGVTARGRYAGSFRQLPGPGILCAFSDGLFESGAYGPDVPRSAIAQALAEPAEWAAQGHLAEAAQEATRQLEELRNSYPCAGHSDDIMAVCVALGPARPARQPADFTA